MRLNGLCPEPPKPFLDHEEAMTLAAPNVMASASGNAASYVQLRVRRSLIPSAHEAGIRPVVRYLGAVDPIDRVSSD